MSARKLTSDQVLSIRRRRKNGERLMDLAAAFGVDLRTVWKIVHRVEYRDVPEERHEQVANAR